MNLLNPAPEDSPQWFRRWVDGVNSGNTFGVVMMSNDITKIENRLEVIDEDITTIKGDIKSIKKMLSKK